MCPAVHPWDPLLLALVHPEQKSSRISDNSIMVRRKSKVEICEAVVLLRCRLRNAATFLSNAVSAGPQVKQRRQHSVEHFATCSNVAKNAQE